MSTDPYSDLDPFTYARVFSTIAYHMPTHQADIDIVEWLISLDSEVWSFPRKTCPRLNARARVSAVPLSVVGGTRVNFDDLFAPAFSLRKEEAATRTDERRGHNLIKLAVTRATSDGTVSQIEDGWGKVS